MVETHELETKGGVFQVYISGETLERMRPWMDELGASVEWLASTAIEDYVLRASQGKKP